ncbi:Tetraspanin [Dirofilaria immitis]|nr:Tetraspanin [Dirofilaria immitis]
MAMFNGRVLLSIIETIIEDTIILYRDDPNLQLFVNWIQINVNDVNMLREYKSLEAGGVPFSCCKATESTTSSLPNMYCGLDSRKHPEGGSDDKGTYLREDIHQKGCVEVIKRFLINNTLYIASAVFIFLMTQLFCLFLHLYCKIKSSDSKKIGTAIEI